MRKFLCVLAILAMANMVYPADTQFGESTVLNKLLKGSYKGTTTRIKNAVTVNETSNPSITVGVGTEGWKRVSVWVDGTVGTQWNLTPLAGDTTIGAYFPLSTAVVSSDDTIVNRDGTIHSRISYDSPLISFSSIRVSNDAMLTFDINGCDMFNVRLDNATDGGSGTTVSVYATPSN